ncbi:PREDICTED: telomere repeat-binding factor 5-like [Camelina sativa]|uniref:Telomere repeat-binding factor 5-like n=1 Tax=Camelina sativa TaxID=90675 RepID=A0ABM0VZ76_CAMSA|nr:PREDICTED: telomere repeat-binding factor 5-like [Camelina sativa]
MLGHRKNKWTAEEEEALVAGIAKHGSGKWANIIEDPEFAPHLLDRTNINLKDKWRNMKNRVGNMEKSMAHTLKSALVVVSNESSPSSSSDMINDTRYVPMSQNPSRSRFGFNVGEAHLKLMKKPFKS